MSPAAQRAENFVENRQHALAAPAIRRSERSRYFSVTISRMGPTFCAMPPWTSTRLSCRFWRAAGEASSCVQNAVLRHESAAADAGFGIAFRGRHAFDQLDAGPDAAGILPAAAGAAEPFAENRARQHQPAFVLLQCAVSERRLAGRPHAQRNQRGEQVGGHREARAFRDAVNATDQFDAAPGPDDAGEQVGQALAGTFDARRHDAAGDDGGFEQAKIIFREIKHVREAGDVRGGAEINAGQPQQRFVNHAQIGFHRRLRRRRRGHARPGQSRRSGPCAPSG